MIWLALSTESTWIRLGKEHAATGLAAFSPVTPPPSTFPDSDSQVIDMWCERGKTCIVEMSKKFIWHVQVWTCQWSAETWTTTIIPHWSPGSDKLRAASTIPNTTNKHVLYGGQIMTTPKCFSGDKDFANSLKPTCGKNQDTERSRFISALLIITQRGTNTIYRATLLYMCAHKWLPVPACEACRLSQTTAETQTASSHNSMHKGTHTHSHTHTILLVLSLSRGFFPFINPHGTSVVERDVIEPPFFLFFLQPSLSDTLR